VHRRRAVLSLVLAAASCAAAIPLVGLAAPSAGYPDLRSDAPRGPFTAQSGNRLLLRFDGFVTNVGSGPLDVTGNPSVGGGMKQRVHQGGNSWSVVGSPEVRYESADGHNHFHLMYAMQYSLRRADSDALVAPAQKVGFCLYDLEGASGAPVQDPPTYSPTNFCQVGNPTAEFLSMGVSAGWRDVYGDHLPFQWVDVSTTPPGSYRIGAETDPLGRIVESNEGNNGLVFTPFTIPGYVAKAVGPVSVPGQQTAVTLDATAFGSAGTRRFKIETAPAHGTLNVGVGGTITGNQVLYTPQPGYAGPDSFQFSANNGGSFPTSPPRAAATLQVGANAAPAVQLSGAPASMVAGTSAQLTATVVNAGPGVTWSTTAGTISPTGLLVAPATVPAGGTVTVTARSTQAPSAGAQAVIAIQAVGPPKAAPLPPGGGGASATATGPLAPPSLKRNGRSLVVRTTPGVDGKLVMAAIRNGKVLARCRVRASAGKRVTCLLRLPRSVRTKTVRIAIGLKAADGTRGSARAVARA
jgi:hypothetical protein